MAIATGTALLAAAGIGAGASVIGGIASNKAAGSAQRAQISAGKKSLIEQQRQYDLSRADMLAAREQAREDTAPYREFGQNAISPLQNLLTGSGDINAFLQSTPGYQASLEGGVNAIDAASANAGLLHSGARAKELTRFGSDLASQTLNQERNALFNALNIGTGQAANAANISTGTANALSQLGSSFANAATGIYGGIGQANAQGAMNRASAFNNALGGIAGAAGNALGVLSTPTPTPSYAQASQTYNPLMPRL